MDWVGIIVVLALILFTGGMIYKVVNSPTFWFRLFGDLGKLIWPVFWKIISKQEDEETTKRRLEVWRRGGEWDMIKKRERPRR
jgi:hypothetical protein